MVAGGNRKGPGLRKNHGLGDMIHMFQYYTHLPYYQVPLRTGNDVIHLAVQAGFSG